MTSLISWMGGEPPMNLFRKVHVLCPYCYERDEYVIKGNSTHCKHCGAEIIPGEDF